MNPHDKTWSWAQKHRPIYINVDGIVDAIFFALMFFLLTAFLGN